MSSDNIFESKFTLRLKDKFFEQQYQDKRYKKLKKYNIILSSVLFVMAVAITIIISLQKAIMFENFVNQYRSILQFITTLLLSINLILSIVVKNPKVQSWITYINYIYILFVFNTLKFYFVRILEVDMLIYTFLFTVEMFFRKSWFFIGLIDFVPGVYLQVVSIVLNYVMYSPTSVLSLQFRFSINAGIMMITNGITYFYIKEQKRSFYYYLFMKSKYDWFKNVIDNMNSGFMSVEKNEIQYFNYTMVKLINNNLTIKETAADSSNDYLTLSLDDIFVNIQSETYSINNFNDTLQVLLQNYMIFGNNFIFLGTKNIESLQKSTINLEIFGRCYSSDHSVIDKYEFIFNDITRSKQIEEKNAEFKYKNLFLSKVAHEFKNPLLCIGELVDQISEGTGGSTAPSVQEVLKQIKSMSNYLIILVKDLDFFSQKNTGIIKSIEPDYVDLNDLIKFCYDIVTALIKKAQKDNYIKFEIIKGKNLPKQIYSDEIKLKQILINLLSNSIKYTQSGTVTFALSLLEDGIIRFKITDTGKGISDNQKEKLFIPFSNEFDKLNKVSSGLGLSIVKDLTELINSKINFESQTDKGSSFWFEIPTGCTQNDINNLSYCSEATAKGIHFNETQIDTFMKSTRLLSLFSGIQRKEILAMVVDDELVMRQSTVRLITKYLKEKSYDVTIIEASDGIDCLYKYKMLVKEGKKLSFILSDETMEFMNGGTCAEILKTVCCVKNFSHVPFLILSAYENLRNLVGVNEIYTKPLRKQNLEEILKNYLLNK
jgi:signal transduction histidine kinase/CheY-like chemotaxis protein